MSVQMLVGPPAYNKAPSPDKEPAQKLYPIKLSIEEEQIWVSVPQPDKLHLVVQLEPKHFAPWYNPDDPQDYGRMVMQALATGLAGPVTMTKYIEHAYLYTQVQVGFGEAKQPVFFALSKTKGDSHGPHTLSIQLNPRLLTEEGIFELLHRLREVTGKRLIVGSMLADARVSRLDVAIDIVGIDLADILVRLKGEQKRCHRNGPGGRLETVEIWRKGTKLATTKNRSAMLYDKRAERIDAGCPPPHGLAPVTRVEVTKKRFGNKPMLLSKLNNLTNPLTGLLVGRVRAAAQPLSWAFLRYVDARRGVGSDRAASNLGLSSARATQFEDWYSSHPSDLLNGEAVWSLWNEGLLATGTHLLVEAANTKSPGVPPPALYWGS